MTLLKTDFVPDTNTVLGAHGAVRDGRSAPPLAMGLVPVGEKTMAGRIEAK